MTKQFINNPIESIFNDTLINFCSNCPLFEWLILNNHTYPRLVKLGLIEDLPYNTIHYSTNSFYLLSKVLRNHFSITSELKNYIDDNIGYNWEPKNRIGIHIRKGDPKSDLKESRMFLLDSDISSFLSCPVLKQFKNLTLYLASDSTIAKNTFKRLNSKMGNYPILASRSKAQHTSVYSTPIGPTETLYTSVADMMSLAQSEYVIGTQYSTYSVVAAAFQGKLPYLVKKQGGCEQVSILSYYEKK